MKLKLFHFYARRLAAWGLIFLAMVSIVNEARISKDFWKSFLASGCVDSVSLWENRLAGLKSQIPQAVTRVGYISSDPEHIEFYLTQYTLIPIILERGTNPDWIIANYPAKTIHIVLRKQLDLEQYAVDNFGYGLYLVHKR
jgi:hypothetical protein